MIGAYIQHPAEGHQRQVGLHIMLVQRLQRPLAQQLPALDGGGQVADKLGAPLRPVPLAQGLHGLPVGAVQAGQGPHRPADADAAAFAQYPIRHLGDLVGQDMEILVKVRRVAQQHRDHLSRGKKADAAEILGGQPVHRRHEGRFGAVAAVLVEQGGHHHRVARLVVHIPQQAALPGVALGLGLPLQLGIVVQHQGHHHGRPLVGTVGPGAGLPEHGVLGVDLLPDGPQFRPQTLHGQRLEHIADDIVLNGLFGVLKIIISAQKGDIRGGPHLPHLPGQLYARDKGHPDIGQQQVWGVLFHQLKGVQSVAGAPHQAEAIVLPGDHGTHRFPQLVLVVGHDHGILRLCSHWATYPFCQGDGLPAPCSWIQ